MAAQVIDGKAIAAEVRKQVAADVKAIQASHDITPGLAVVLVGDEPYYGPFGFKMMAKGTVLFPAPVDQNRILACELVEGAALGVAGIVRHAASRSTSLAPPHGRDGSQQQAKTNEAAE